MTLAVRARPGSHPRLRTRAGKACFDRVGAALLVVIALPLLLLVALAILVVDGRPVLFAQTRVGRDGVPFTMLKFRTMRSMSHGVGGVKRRGDPRVTRLGRCLRRSSLDELPQLGNVLRGDMSLVGPRPPLPEELSRMPAEALCRLRVRPGMTGLWQVGGRADLSASEALRLDRDYVENWSLALDVAVLWRTIGAVLSGRGAY
jgi:lipopolysaccharide/colanic/teichoic acid biosynthesis glycosyltransferase